METFILILGIILTLCGAIGLIYCKKNNELNKSLQELREEKASLEAQNDDIKRNQQHLAQQQDEAAKAYQNISQEYKALVARCEGARQAAKEQQEYIKSTEENLNSIIEKRRKEKTEQLEKELKALEEKTALSILEKKRNADLEIAKINEQLASESAKVTATITAIQSLQTDEEKEKERTIQVDEEEREDITYLLNNVANRLKHPDVLYKLIWSEYIQKPTNAMLDIVLQDKDCAGIYKITNLKNKKSYIGRSTSVRRRLTDHIKSAVGISTIADQQVHKAMREEGLWNFKFELVEACDKSLLGEREKYYINFFKCQSWGYNAVGGSSFKGD